MEYFVFGQDMRTSGARTSWSSLPSQQDGRDELVVELDDPIARGDIAPQAGANALGDIISGAFSLYSTRLCDALTAFGITLNTKPVSVILAEDAGEVGGYHWVLGVADIQMDNEDDELECFTLDEQDCEGLSFFDLNHRLRIVDARLKEHLEACQLEGVFIVPTQEFSGQLKMALCY
jgi:hypothetical protein